MLPIYKLLTLEMIKLPSTQNRHKNPIILQIDDNKGLPSEDQQMDVHGVILKRADAHVRCGQAYPPNSYLRRFSYCFLTSIIDQSLYVLR